MNLYLFIARKFTYKSASRGQLSRISNIIATVSVAISVAVIMVAIAVANGFRAQIREKASGFSGDITLSAPGTDVVNHLYPVKVPAYIEELRRMPQVESVGGVAYRSGILKSTGHIQGVVFKGVDSCYNRNFFAAHLICGSLPDYSADTLSSDILISKTLSDALGYGLDDKVFAYFVGEDVTFRIFNVCGIYDAILEELDSKLIIADIGLIRDVNGWDGDMLSGYEIILQRKYRNETSGTALDVENLILESTPEDEPYTLLPSTVEERFYVLYDWLRLLDVNVLILLALMIAVAGFNMVSGLLIILFERISQIGLLKAVGMKNSNIAKIFLYRASFTVLKGFLAGNIIALAFCFLEWKFKFIPLDAENYFVNHVPVCLEWETVVVVNLAAFAAIMVILLVPCHLISRISPAKTLVVK